MKKKILITFLILTVLIVLGAVKFMLNPLTKSEEQIREKLLEETPFGTHMEDVIKYIGSKKKLSKKKWEVTYISHEHGFTHQRVYPRRIVGEKSIRASLGDYGIIFETNVTVFWGFDENSKLIDIWVWKTIDSF